MPIAVIGGTGFYNFLDEVRPLQVTNEYGRVELVRGHYQGKEIIFLPRHGKNHEFLAHQVNYRANMLALKELGITRILGTSAVGSLNPQMQVGDLVLLDQFVDVTTNRPKSFNKYSVDMSEPYCPELRAYFLKAATEIDLSLHEKGIYICVDGPRYETSAEIKLYRQWGMDVVGMTNATEAVLARELGICYAIVAIVTDLAAGISDVPPDLDTHKRVVQENRAKLSQLLLKAITLVPEERSCQCQAIYESALAARASQLSK
ncbi:S-methyl-5'-thioadenosine phosphorylase [Neomoorella glycerini]|uniref:Purine nucleoside phosphorylase n=1 Tax=Neomoorella glycerini TaxID=55779 RepID=A0A6I5ZTZ2_9FIRM|nr:MTAP family purine nucleoside phosphorylase [Moorella glycerini]QGP93085.1 S-methyl-5'-thioadenosine phosphorylase [Moorella glycerini]